MGRRYFSMRRTLRSTLAVLLFLCVLPLQAQTTGSKRLSTYLKELEARFEVRFSYVDTEIAEITVRPYLGDNIEVILQDLQSQTQLQIRKISDRYYGLVKTKNIRICGRVLDNYARNRVPGATVEVLGTDQALVTDAEGRFVFTEVPRDATLRVRYLGHITRYVKINDLLGKSECLRILLSEKYQQLEEVVVYQVLTSGIEKQQDASILLRPDDFGILPGLSEPDVLQTLQALPGVKSINETVSTINIRGGTNDQNLVYWNGIKMYQSGHFFGLISAFNPYLTQKVTLYKNGTPAYYGDGVSGSILLETENEIQDDFFGGAGLSFISGDAFGQVNVADGLALQFSARRSVTDFLNTPTYRQFTKRVFQDTDLEGGTNTAQEVKEDFYFTDFSSKVLYDINEDHQVRVSFLAIDNRLDYQFADTNTAANALNQSHLSFGLQLKNNWTNALSTFWEAYSTRYRLDAESSTGGQQQLFQNNEVLEQAVKLQVDYRFSKEWLLRNGYQFIETGVTNETLLEQPPFVSRIKGVIRNQSVFSELEHSSFSKKFFARMGVRINAYENLDTFTEILIEPRLNLNWRISDRLRAEVLGEFKSQVSQQVIDLEQNFFGIEKRRWILSDGISLPVTKSKQVSAGLNYEKNDLYVGLEGFYKEVDGISTSTQGFQNQNQFNGELGSYRVRGLELLINQKGGNYSTWLSYTFNQNDYEFEALLPPQFPNNLDVRHTLTLASTYRINQLKLGLGVNLRSGKPYTPAASVDTSGIPSEIVYQTPNSEVLPMYWRVDGSAIYSFRLSPSMKAQAGISLLNMLDRTNVLDRYYRLDNNDQIEEIKSQSLGITPNLSFRVSF